MASPKKITPKTTGVRSEMQQRKGETSAPRGKQFFVSPKKESEQNIVSDFRMRLGGIPLETRAGFELIVYRLKTLLHSSSECWEEINRDEHGSFWHLFRKYHLPLLLPFFVFFIIRELIHFASFALFVRHTFVALPIFTGLYAAYIFLLGVIAEETAEFSGGRFSPQSGMRIAIFSSLILSFLSVTTFFPIVGMPLLLIGLFWHYQQLFSGARTLLNISESYYKIYRLSHILVWLFLALTAFIILSVISFVSAKLGLVAI